MEKKVPKSGYFVLICLMLLVQYSCYAQAGEVKLLQAINNSRSTTGDQFFHGVTNSVYPLAFALPIAVVAVGAIRHDSGLRSKGGSMVVATGINLALTYGLKYTVQRQRPYERYTYLHPYQLENGSSFPSGHTSVAFCTATEISLAFRKWYIVAPAYVYAAGIGYSRMYLGVHYPTDVVGGALVGVGSAWLGYRANKWLHHRKHARN